MTLGSSGRRLGKMGAALFVTAGISVGGCAIDSGSGPGPEANTSKGPITIWYSNNPEEVAWGKAMVKAWNEKHPDQKVTGQEIPAGKTSEEGIYASITAGTAPCLIYNTAPSAIPQFEKAGGLVPFDTFPDGDQYILARSGPGVDQFRSSDGKFYQFPWKLNPVMIIYNKKILQEAGVDPENPPLHTYKEFLDTSRKIVSSKAAKAAIYPAPSSEFFQSWFDFYPLYAAASRKQLVEDGKATFDSLEGIGVGEFWRTMYAEKLAPQEKYNGDSFADGVSAMAIVGPWAIKVYGDKVDWGAVPVPTEQGTSAAKTYTFSDAKNVGLYYACENRLTAWNFLKFTTSKANDGAFLDATGQMLFRKDLVDTYPEFFAKNPSYTQFAEQAARVIEVPNVPNSTEIWQEFRNMWTRGVVFGEGNLSDEFARTAEKVDRLVDQGTRE